MRLFCFHRQEYKIKLMNETNEWDHGILAGVKEGPADCISIDEVATALKKMQGGHSPVIIKFPDFSRHFKSKLTEYQPSQQ